MNKIEQGIFLDFDCMLLEDSCLPEGKRSFNMIYYEISEILGAKNRPVFKFGYGPEPYIITCGSFRRIVRFGNVFPASHSFAIQKAARELEVLLTDKDNIKCSLFSANYRKTDETHAKL